MPNISEINGYLINADTASYAVTASFLSGSVTSASYAATASFVATASWALTSSLATLATTADTAKTVITIANTTNATFYPTFVDSNNTPTAASEVVYTSDRFTFNPSTRVLTINGGIIALGAIITGSLNITGGLAVIGAITSSIFSGSSFTGSLFGTASWAVSASQAISASRATTSSFAISASWAPGGTASTTGSFTGSFTGSLFGTIKVINIGGAWGTMYPLIGSTFNGDATVYTIQSPDYKYDVTNNQLIVSSVSGSFTGSLFGTASFATTAQTLLGSVTSASFASTASFVNTLNQNILITGSLTVGTSSLGSTENTLVVGLPPAGGTGEGGQILLQASGGLYTTASMIDNYQNKFRVLRGTNAGSDAFKLQLDMHTGQMQLPNYNSATALTGSEVAALGVDNNGNILTTTIPGAVLTNNYIGAGFTNPIVTYMPFGATTVSGNESQRQVASPVAGVIKNFYLRTNNTSPAGGTTTFTIRVNGVATNVKITIGGSLAAGKFSDTTNSASVAVGDDISLQVSTSAANSPQINQYSLGIYPS